MKAADKQEGSVSKFRPQIISLKASMERIRKRFVQNSNGVPKIELCCLSLRDVFSGIETDVIELQDVNNSFMNYERLPDPVEYLYIIFDLREVSFDQPSVQPEPLPQK